MRSGPTSLQGAVTSRESRGRQERFRSGAWPNTTSVADSRTGSLSMFTGMCELRAGSRPSQTNKLKPSRSREKEGRWTCGTRPSCGMGRHAALLADDRGPNSAGPRATPTTPSNIAGPPLPTLRPRQAIKSLRELIKELRRQGARRELDDEGMVRYVEGQVRGSVVMGCGGGRLVWQVGARLLDRLVQGQGHPLARDLDRFPVGRIV